MSYTNETTHYDLPQWAIGDAPSIIDDLNPAFNVIDAMQIRS